MKHALIIAVLLLATAIVLTMIASPGRSHTPHTATSGGEDRARSEVLPVALVSRAPQLTAMFDPPPTPPVPELPDFTCTLACLIEILADPENPQPAPARCQPCTTPSLAKIWLAIDNDEFDSGDKGWIANDVDWIEAIILTIQDEEGSPNLTPVDAGMPGDGRTFTSLTQCVAQCLAWAQEADAEINTNQPDHQVIGYALDSIRLALPQLRTLGELE